MKLSDITGTTHSASIKIGDGDLNFTFAEYSPKTIKDAQKKVQAAAKSKDDTTFNIELLLLTLKSWDVTNDDGSPAVINRENLMLFGTTQFGRIVEAMNEACSPKKTVRPDEEE